MSLLIMKLSIVINFYIMLKKDKKLLLLMRKMPCLLKLKDLAELSFINIVIMRVDIDGLITQEKVPFQVFWIEEFLLLNLILAVGFVCILVHIIPVQNYVSQVMSAISII